MIKLFNNILKCLFKFLKNISSLNSILFSNTLLKSSTKSFLSVLSAHTFSISFKAIFNLFLRSVSLIFSSIVSSLTTFLFPSFLVILLYDLYLKLFSVSSEGSVLAPYNFFSFSFISSKLLILFVLIIFF